MVELLLGIFLIAIFVLILDFRSSIKKEFKQLHRNIGQIREEISDMKQSAPADAYTKAEPFDVFAKKETTPEKQTGQRPETTLHEQKTEAEKITLDQRIEEIAPPPYDLAKERQQKTSAKSVTFSKKPKTKTAKPQQTRDWEKLIGEKLFQYIGILFTVLAVGFFVKWAIDKGWINEVGRVAIGYMAGAILIGVAHWLHKNFRAFSSVLMGGGLSVLYVTTAMAFQLYGLFSQTASFMIMVVITGFSVIMALLYNRKELAVIALIGGFITPIMASDGGGNYKILFSYLIILDLGMLVLANLKNWRIINTISFFATVIFYSAWLALQKDDNIPLESMAFVFVGVFYLIFLAMHLFHSIRNNEKITVFNIILLVSNAFWFYGAGMVIADELYPQYQGLFTALVGLFHFVIAAVLYNRKQIDKNVIFVLISFVMIFISLAAPVQLKGNHITLFWAAEAVLLLCLSQLMGVRIIKVGAALVLLVMFGSLLMDWEQLYLNYFDTEHIMPILLNKAFVTSMGSIVSLALFSFLLKRDKDKAFSKYFSGKTFTAIVNITLLVVVYVSLTLELNYQTESRLNSSKLELVALASFNSIFAAILLSGSYLKRIKYLGVIAVLLSVATTLSIGFVNQTEYSRIVVRYLEMELNHHFGLLQAFNVLALMLSAVMVWQVIRKLFEKQNLANFALWYMAFVIIFVLSTALDAVSIALYFTTPDEVYYLQEQTIKVGYPILWGISSLVFMVFGMRLSNRTLRVISLSLFIVTLVKLFVYDIQEISEGGRIAAFISLGVFLLLISFLYQKLKKLIFDDAEKNNNAELSTENQNTTDNK